MNKIAIITGGSRGIGKAVAHEFASHGFNLIICGRNQESLENLAQSLTSEKKISVDFFKADLSIKKDCLDFVDFVKSKTSNVNVLVNNAGTFQPGRLIDEPEGQMKYQMDLNFFSAYHITRGLWNYFPKNDRSHIFNMCSIASITAYAAGGGYSVSKYALMGFSKSLREEGKADGIRVSAILPGATFTDSWSEAGIPESRFMRASDVAKSIYNAYEINEFSNIEEILIRPIQGDI